MAGQEDFLNLGTSKVSDKSEPNNDSADNQSTKAHADGEDVGASSSPTNQIIERTLHTIHTIVVYPNGEIYLKKPVSWLDKKGNIVKKKEKKKLAKVQEAKLGKEESY